MLPDTNPPPGSLLANTRERAKLCWVLVRETMAGLDHGIQELGRFIVLVRLRLVAPTSGPCTKFTFACPDFQTPVFNRMSAYDLTCRSAYDLTCWFAGSLAG